MQLRYGASRRNRPTSLSPSEHHRKHQERKQKRKGSNIIPIWHAEHIPFACIVTVGFGTIFETKDLMTFGVMMLCHAVRFVLILPVLVVRDERKFLVGANGSPALRRVGQVAGLHLQIAFQGARQALPRDGRAPSRLHHFQHDPGLIVPVQSKGGAIVIGTIPQPELVARGAVVRRTTNK